ncbi:alpha/beta hydrolase [Paenibacillus thermotolerans]|uniref:alpha/beta hydrolase n=1 Tax=Paenibacillus thermotolerans TaxID=3027807 RepID=UPI002367F18C|nr:MULTISPECIES: alpha/beta hydrolase [unclassified Paenibacillus]
MNDLLWPEGAPNAMGTEAEDQPAIEAYLVSSSEGAAPCVLVCPGGGYWVRAEHEGRPIAQWLNSLGISAFVLRYRVKPYGYPNAILDAQRAIRTIRARANEWNIDPDRVGVLGFSAGGHLAACSAVLPAVQAGDGGDAIDAHGSKPNLAVLCYPVITFQEPYLHEGSMIAQLGEQPDEALRDLLSCELQVDKDTPPAFLWHTADDSGVPVENSMMFAAALSRSGIPFELHIFEKGRHGLGLAEDDASVGQWTALCARWLQSNGWTSGTDADASDR